MNEAWRNTSSEITARSISAETGGFVPSKLVAAEAAVLGSHEHFYCHHIGCHHKLRERKQQYEVANRMMRWWDVAKDEMAVILRSRTQMLLKVKGLYEVAKGEVAQ